MDEVEEVVADATVDTVVVGAGAQEQTELYLKGAEPHAEVKLGGNPVVAVEIPCV
jgi:hypothetical protein